MKTTWLDENMYPFRRHTLEVAPSEEIHYLDEGQGEAIVFVHGTPTWSFVWREFIKELSSEYRCIAPDHLGFGLSSKPEQADYTPQAHASRLQKLIERLHLRDLTLVVHDFGGPIGLPYALHHTSNVKRVVVMNSWMWSLAGNKAVEMASGFLAGPVGRFLYRRLNFSPKVLLKAAYADKSKLTSQIHDHYRAPFPTPSTRQAPWILARELTASSEWFESLCSKREALEGIPMLIIWGMRDILVSTDQLQRWEKAFPEASVARLDEVGHFVQEEGTREAVRLTTDFLRQQRTS